MIDLLRAMAALFMSCFAILVGVALVRHWQTRPRRWRTRMIAQAGVTRMGRDAASGSVAERDSTRSPSGDAPQSLDRKDQHQ